MYFKVPRRKASRYIHPSREEGESAPRRPTLGLQLLLALFILLLFLALSAAFLKDLSSQIAVSDARDIVTAEINRVVAELMQEGDFDPNYFVGIEKNERGEVTAISSNMARVNALSAEILEQVIGEADSRTLHVHIPVGNLSGVSLLMGRGPAVPVEIMMLTSSRVEFQNQVVTAGINQTKYQIGLRVIVDIDVLIPWGTESTQVVTEVLVPDTYLNLQ